MPVSRNTGSRSSPSAGPSSDRAAADPVACPAPSTATDCATSTAVNIIHGPGKFARFFLGLAKRYGDGALASMQVVRVNGQLGLATPGWSGPTKAKSSPARIGAFTVRDGLVYATYDIANPRRPS